MKKTKARSLVYLGPTIKTDEGIKLRSYDAFKNEIPEAIKKLEHYPKIEVLITETENLVELKQKIEKLGTREFMVYKKLAEVN